MSKLPGITRQEEEERLRDTISIAEGKLERTRQDVKNLADELHEMLEVYDENDKEALALWHNTDARFKEVNQELRRAEQARKKPYFGRIDFRDKQLKKEEVYYIGRSVIAADPAHPEVIDWRAPVAGIYYDGSLGEVSYSVKGEGRYEVNLSRKRTYEIEQDVLKDFYDSDVIANDELLTKYLAKNKKAVLGEIIATIQKEQNEAIRKKPQHNMIIQGAAGSGKTTVAMHRISYILYNYELEFAPQDFYIIGSNQVLLNYITGVLPELNVYGVSQMTMEQLFIRLLYEDWDKNYTVKPVVKGVTPPIKGTLAWFGRLEAFCDRYERELIPRGDVVLEKNGVILLSAEAVEKILQKNAALSRADKIERLTEHLIAKLENEISGKYYSYTAGEKRRLLRRYETYFGKREWKGSIFERYDSFLTEQGAELPGTAFDVYDLAALAYLYKRLKETEIIREAGHVVIDEAQDFGMMVYSALKYCLTKCTYTIMGDVAQNISMDYGLNDWKELRELMLPGEFDYFGLLRKSYRNTVEIAQFATDILRHGSFQVYPVQPIIRHGAEVSVKGCASYRELIGETADIVRRWLRDGRETVAIVCADEREAQSVTESLSGMINLLPDDFLEFHTGVMVLPLAYTKGLEFDGVLIFNASARNYPAEDGYVKRLYVAATRALHELAVLYEGTLTALIAEPVSEDRLREETEPVKPAGRPALKETEETNAQRYIREAKEGAKEMAEREHIGPRRIEVKAGERQEQPRRVQIADGRTAEPPHAKLRKKPAWPKSGLPQEASEYGGMPDDNALRPAGHARIDCAVRMCMKGGGYYDILSSYGTLRITPLSQEVVRVSFARGKGGSFPENCGEFGEGNAKHKYRENREAIEILTEKLLVRVEKKTGAVSFLTPQGKLLLSERGREPRQIGEERVWNYFDWDRGESLIVRGETDGELMQMGLSARYISFGRDSGRMPAVASSRGYELLFPPRYKTLLCNIAVYGPYISAEGTETADYYFKISR